MTWKRARWDSDGFGKSNMQGLPVRHLIYLFDYYCLSFWNCAGEQGLSHPMSGEQLE